MLRTARFSRCGKFRYALGRRWGEGERTVLFIGLNPSTADHMRDDPTIRRCIDFARRWGYDGLTIANIFAYRTPYPRVLRAARDPVGPRNDHWIRQLAERSDLVIAAWGAGGEYLARADVVTGYLSDLYCLGRTKDGWPRHPLYLPKSARAVRYARRRVVIPRERQGSRADG